MIPAKFDYARPSSLDEAVRALADGGEDAKVIAGGQSLLPLLRLRLAFPDLLVDIGRLNELRGVHDEGATLWIGALTTHDQVLHDPLIAEHCGLLAAAAATVADPAVRHRATLGGSLSHADPAADLPAVAGELGADWGYHYEKFHRTAQAWAIVGVAALARRSNGHVAEARIGLTNMGTVPVRAR